MSSEPVIVARTVTVEQAAKLLGISRNSAYEAVRQGQIPSIRIGKRLVIPVVQLERLLDKGAGNNAP